MGLQAFLADTLYDGHAAHKGHALLAEGGVVKAVVPQAEVPAAAEKVVLSGLSLAPGLVDLQVNGGGGVLFNDRPNVGGLAKIAEAHRRKGTTALLPTLISEGTDKIPQAMDAVRKVRDEKDSGVIGLHLEGPFLNPERKGVHEAQALRLNPSETLRDVDFSNLGKMMITLAPELLADGELQKLSARGAVLCAGHSQPTLEQLNAAKAAGLRGITHLFNAMGPINAREPGLAGLALNDDDLWCSIICDGQHVWNGMIRVAIRAKPAHKLFFVSDAMPPAGQQDPQPFQLYGKKINVKGGRCSTENGGFAGSALTLFECVQRAVNDVKIPVEDALAMASLYPAEFLGVEKERGSFTPGARADIIAFDDKMNLQKVFISGQEIAS
jgi:N-acetylglucosamine-6-phosphate deacetylase